MRMIACVGAFVVVFSFATLAAAQVELKNDGFASGQTAGVQAGFVTGEAGASRFVAPAAGRQLLKVQFFYGNGGNVPANNTPTDTLKVWDDSAGTDVPGAELFSMDYQLTGSDSALSEVDLSADNVIVPAQFRVGILFQHAG